MPVRAEIVPRKEERGVLARWARRLCSPEALALGCRIVLAVADRKPTKAVAARLRCDRSTVGKCRGRFVKHRLDGLHEPRPGRPRSIGDDEIQRVVVKTLKEQPPNASTGRAGRWRPRRDESDSVQPRLAGLRLSPTRRRL
jgi:hypothetical protein